MTFDTSGILGMRSILGTLGTLMEILIDDLQEEKTIDIPKLRQVALRILQKLGCQEPCELSIVLVDDQEIRRLNREYRGIDRSTDVLSFAQQEQGDSSEPILFYAEDESFPRILGDVILSVETTQKQAEEYGTPFEKELYFLLTHGILHLLGYDHHTDHDARKMKGLEQEVLKHLDC
jgi:probable rRNA maturation factor